MHLALGGCLGAPPIRYGITSDTGGHIAYVLDAAFAQAAIPTVSQVSIVTRRFQHAALGAEYGLARQRIGAKVTIDRIATSSHAYLEKDALAAELPEFLEAFIRQLARLPTKPDVIHAHFADAAGLARVVSRRFGIPFVYTPHAFGLDKLLSEPDGPALQDRIAAEREAIRTADALIVSTHDEAHRQVAGYGIPLESLRVECLSPGVPQHRAGRDAVPCLVALDHWLDEPGRPLILAISRAVPKKNLASVIRAFAMTPGLADRANLVILAGQHGVGARSAEGRRVVAELKGLARDPRLAGRVALPPQHTAADVHALYSKAAKGGVFVNPAFHEPFGLTIVEAAALGVPVVATRNGGPVDIIASTGHGLLVDPCDDAAIGAACLRILSDTRLHGQLSRAGRDNAALFSWTRYAERSVALYASLPRSKLVRAPRPGRGAAWKPAGARVVSRMVAQNAERTGSAIPPGGP